jgi:hypothetical protein
VGAFLHRGMLLYRLGYCSMEWLVDHRHTFLNGV